MIDGPGRVKILWCAKVSAVYLPSLRFIEREILFSSGPTSSYRAVLSEESNRRNATEPDTPHTGSALAQSLTHAIVSIAPPTPTIPAIPPELSHEFRTQLLGLAFEYCLSQSGLVQERYFYRDMANNPCVISPICTDMHGRCLLTSAPTPDCFELNIIPPCC